MHHIKLSKIYISILPFYTFAFDLYLPKKMQSWAFTSSSADGARTQPGQHIPWKDTTRAGHNPDRAQPGQTQPGQDITRS